MRLSMSLQSGRCIQSGRETPASMFQAAHRIMTPLNGHQMCVSIQIEHTASYLGSLRKKSTPFSWRATDGAMLPASSHRDCNY